MKLKHLLLGAVGSLAAFGLSETPATAQEPFIGNVQAVGFNFCPRGWAQADGQLLSIAQNTALFSILGTMYGGDGRTTFALPDLRGRTPINVGTGPGLSTYREGQRAGVEETIMTVNQLPSHTHMGGIQTVSSPPNTNSPVGNAFANTGGTNVYIDDQLPSGNFMRPETMSIANAGGGQAQNNMQPFLTVNYCVALQGIFPSRN